MTLSVTAPEAKHPVHDLTFLPQAKHLLEKTLTQPHHPLMGSKAEIFFFFFTDLLSLLWITLHVTRFSLTQLFCQRLSWMGESGGGGCYVPWVELVLRSICARKTEVSPGMPPPEVGFFLFCNSEDRHDPGGVFGRHGCEEKDAVPTRFSPTVTSVVTLRVNVIIASLSLPVVSGQR